jgi:hypothetical protein
MAPRRWQKSWCRNRLSLALAEDWEIAGLAGETSYLQIGSRHFRELFPVVEKNPHALSIARGTGTCAVPAKVRQWPNNQSGTALARHKM